MHIKSDSVREKKAMSSSSALTRVNNANHNALAEISLQINLKDPAFGYVRIHTELKLNQVFEVLESVTIESATSRRKMTGVQWNMMMLLTGYQVKYSKNEEAYFLPIIILPGDVRILLAWNATLLSKDELRAKLQVGDPPRLLLYSGLLPSFPAIETLNWRMTDVQDVAIKEEKQHPTEKKYVLFQTEVDLPRNSAIAQLVFYGNVNAQSWLKKGELVVEENGESKVVADFWEPFECTVLDRERWGLPASTAAIYTFTFANYFQTGKHTSPNALMVSSSAKVWLRLTLEPQFMPQKPTLQIFSISENQDKNGPGGSKNSEAAF
jgi:hypothetical protein